MAIRLLTVAPSPQDATSFYRCHGPLSVLRKQYPNIEIVTPNTVDWTTIKMCDAMLLQRPHNENHLSVCKMAYTQGLPIWVDFDDAFFHILPSNPAFQTYGTQRNIDIIKQILDFVDVVSVSTDKLKELLTPYVKCPIHVIPNAYDQDLLCPIEAPKGHKKRIIWRGGHTHNKDLDVIQEAVVELSHKYTDFNWSFLGHAPWWTNLMRPGSYSIIAPLEIMQYFEMIPQQKALAWVFPLVDCDFNRAKSNIAWIEATYAGSKMLAQGLPEFEKPGCTTFKDNNDFKFKIKQIMDLKTDHLADIKLSREYINENLILRDVNKKRIEIIEELLDA